MSIYIPYEQIELGGFLVLMVASIIAVKGKISAVFAVFAIASLIGYFLGVPYFTKEIVALIIMFCAAIIGYALFLKWEG